jgi:uncharacterized protein YndB with AHSA1/START domain
MKVEYKSDFPITDAACQSATGRTLKAWFGELDSKGDSQNRRDSINWLYAEMKTKDAWWSTTVFVEYERTKGIVNKKDGLIEGYNICVTKAVAAPLDVVYAAFVESERLAQWLGKGIKTNASEGSKFEDSDGNSGQFLRVRENKDVRLTWQGSKSDAPTQVDIAFADKGKGKTGITLTHNRIQTRAEADGLRAAWGTAFDRLKSILEGGGADAP